MSFPHVSNIEDPQAQQALRLAWDRLAQLDALLALIQEAKREVANRTAQIPRLQSRITKTESRLRG